MRINNWSFLIIILVVFLTASYQIFYGYKNAQIAHEETAEAINNQQLKKHLLTTMYNASQERSVILLKMHIERDIFELDELNMQLGEQARIYIKARQKLFTLPSSTKEKELLEKQKAAAMKNGPLQDSIAQMFIEEKRDAATKMLIDKAIPGQHMMRTYINKSLEEFNNENAQIIDNIKNKFEENNRISLILGTLLAFSSIAIIIVVLTRLSRKEEKVIVDALKQAEQANRVKSQFLANMSHEIRTPLNTVLGLAQLGKLTGHDPEARDRFRFIQSSGQHLLGIINEILDLSKLDAGKLRIESIPFELVDNVNDALNYVRETAHARKLSLIVEYDPDLPVWVMGDPHRLRQILVNLLGNAVKFTQQGEVRLGVHSANTQICFTVIDTGIGMDSAQISQIFMAFEQADGTTTRRFGGTGLGLAISRDLAELMGGTITAESVPGHGSTFHLCLPLTKTEQPENYTSSDMQAAGERLAGLRVMAVDDDELNRMVLREMLEYEGATVVLAENGQQALDRLEEVGSSAFDIVIMDVQMPVMDGYKTTQHIHAIAPSLPVVGLTAHAMVEEGMRCMAAGMVAHLTKPVDIDHLATVLLQQLPIKRKPNKYAIPGVVPTGNPRTVEGSQQDSLPGIDVDGALKNLKCDLPTFKKILMTFYRQRRNNCDEITTLLAQGDIKQTRELIHGIRGSSGYLGAWKLHREAVAMEDACKADDLDVAMELLSNFRLCFEEVMDGLEELAERGVSNQPESP